MDYETNQKSTKANLSNRERAELKNQLIAELVADCQSEGDLFGPEGVFTRLKGAVMERLLESEMSTHKGLKMLSPRQFRRLQTA